LAEKKERSETFVKCGVEGRKKKGQKEKKRKDPHLRR